MDCPFFADTFSTCGLKPKLENRYMEDKDSIKYHKKNGYLIPFWCYLRLQYSYKNI